MSQSSLKFTVSEEEKNQVFIPGTLVNLRHSRVFENMLNIIQSIEEDEIFIELTKPFLANTIFEGDHLMLQILRDGYEYQVFGVLDHFMPWPDGKVCIKVHEIRKYKDLRKAKRYNVNLLTQIESEEHKVFQGIVKNISSIGFLMVSKETINKGTKVSLKCYIDQEKGDSITVKGVISRKLPMIGYCETGCEIIGMDEQDKQKLIEYIKCLENQETELLEKYKK